MKNHKKITVLILVGLMIINISGFFKPILINAAGGGTPPTAVSADINNSTPTTVDMVVTGSDFNTFMSSVSPVANSTDLLNITYRSVNPTSATILSSTTLTLIFPISAGTDNSGTLDIQPNTIQDITATGNSLINVLGPAFITDSAAPFVASITRTGATPTNSTTVNYSIVFSEAVSSPSISDFNLTFIGAPLVSSAINTITPTGPNSFNISLNPTTGDGSIHIDLIDVNNISDFSSIPNFLGGPAINDGDYFTLPFEDYIIDNTAPVINPFAGFPATEATSALGATVSYPTPDSIDAVDGIIPALCTPASGSTFPLGTTTVTCDKIDVAGNSATQTSFSIDVVDTKAPIINAYTGLTTFEANAPGLGAVVSYTTPDSIDIVDGTIPAVCTPASGSTFPLGTTGVTCDKTDLHGNIAIQTSFSITVQDTTPPVITLLGVDPQVIEVNNPYIESGANVTDNYDISPSVIIDASAVNTALLGSYTVSYTSTDSNLNSSTITRTVNVVDTTAPVITLNGTDPQVIEVFNLYVENGAVVTDNYWTGLIATINASAVDTTVLGSYPVIYTTIDGSGNPATVTRTVKVVDTTAPIITLNGLDPQTIEAGSLYIESGATVSDNYWPAILPVIDASAINNLVPGSYNVNYTATDGSGNTTTVIRTVIVVDTIAPVIDPASDILNVEATGALGAVVTYVAPNSTDIVDGILPSVCLPASGSTFPLGTTTVTCNKTDVAGNIATPVTFNIQVVDTTAPIIAATPNMTGIEATSASGAVVSYTSPTSTDAVDGVQTSTCLPLSGSTFVIGTSVVTCTQTDANGNIAIPVTFTIQVVDTTAPVILAHANITAEATSPTGAVVTYISPNATDAVDGTLPSICLPASGSTFVFGPAITITCNKTDSHGNIAAPKTFKIHVIDTTKPVITLNGPANVTVAYNSVYTDLGATVTDNYDAAVVVTTTGAVNTAIAGIYTITFNSTDINGNVAIPVTRTITVSAPSHGGGGGGGQVYYQCSDNRDNDGDGKIDILDGGCHTDFNVNNALSYNSAINDESRKAPSTGEVLGEVIFKFTNDLKNGSRGNEVVELQKYLTKDGVYKGKTDGKFGKMTEDAVKKFQIKNNPLIINGIVDANTRTIMNGGVLPVYKFTLDLKAGSKGVEVMQLQSALTRLGFYNGKIDGSFGKVTVNALKKFQTKNNITVTTVVTSVPGVVEAKTRDILNKVI